MVLLILLLFREIFNQEKTKYRNEIERLHGELKLARASLNRETEWKTQVEENYKKLMVEKRQLLSQ